MEKFEKSLCIFVAYLRALYFVHQNNHWTAKGNNFYSQHLMFERIYQSAQEDADAAAEKIVGLFGDEALDLAEQSVCMNAIIEKQKGQEGIESSLALEIKFLNYAKELLEILRKEESDKLTLGLDDLIMQICSNRETACYLLKRQLA